MHTFHSTGNPTFCTYFNLTLFFSLVPTAQYTTVPYLGLVSFPHNLCYFVIPLFFLCFIVFESIMSSQMKKLTYIKIMIFSFVLLSQQVSPIRFIYVMDSTHIVILWSLLLPPIPHMFFSPSHHDPISIARQHLPKRYPSFSSTPAMTSFLSSMQNDLSKYKLVDLIVPNWWMKSLCLFYTSETLPSPMLILFFLLSPT